MKKTYIYNSIGIGLLMLSLNACGDKSDLNDPHGSSLVPEQVTLNSVKNLPGKSIIYFKQPSDKNFLYMKAVYSTDL